MRVEIAEMEQPATLRMGRYGYVLTLRKGLVSLFARAVLARVLHRI